MYTFAHPIEDALERITHSICTLEFEDQRPFYDWLLNQLADLGLLARQLPQQIEFGRLNLNYVVTSKRKLRQLVEEGTKASQRAKLTTLKAPVNGTVQQLAIHTTGGVVTPLALSADHRSADVTGSVDVARSGWCVLRADADSARDPILDLYPYATTSPVYVSVAGNPARSTAAADYFLAWLDRIAEGVARHPDWNTSEERTIVETRIADARRSISARR